jgi:hypothetical protein
MEGACDSKHREQQDKSLRTQSFHECFPDEPKELVVENPLMNAVLFDESLPDTHSKVIAADNLVHGSGLSQQSQFVSTEVRSRMNVLSHVASSLLGSLPLCTITRMPGPIRPRHPDAEPTI